MSTAGYAHCPADNLWFRPAYTEGRCPLCGEPAPADAAALPPWRQIDRSALGVASLALLSLVMLILVLFLYFS
jgi:hypothetical protein